MHLFDFNNAGLLKASKDQLRLNQIIGIAVSLIVHGLVLLYLILPSQPFKPKPVTATPITATMSLVFLEPESNSQSANMTHESPAQVLLPQNTESLPKNAVVSSNDSVPILEAELATKIEVIPPPESITSAKIFSAIEAAATDIIAQDRRPPNAEKPSAAGKVPGRAEPFVHLPLEHGSRSNFSKNMVTILRTIKLSSDITNPLYEMATQRARSLISEPICNDPEKPWADERCWKPQ